jgi:hypothetical protein
VNIGFVDRFFCADALAGAIGDSMVYCSRCGEKAEEDSKFCRHCGIPLNVVSETFTVSGDDLVERVRELVHEGNVTRIIVRSEGGKTLLDIPVTAGAVGVVLFPWMAALGAIAALATKCSITVERTG